MNSSAIKNIFCTAAVLPNATLLSHARIRIENGLIAEITLAPAPASPGASDLVLSDTLLFPGFVNAHCHLELTALGPLPRTDFVSWVKELLRRKTALTDDKIAAGIKDGVNRLLASGVTTILDHVSLKTPLPCFANLPARVIGFGEILGSSEKRARAAVALWDHARKYSPIPLHPTPHAPYSLHPDVLNETLAGKGPFSIHVAESAEEYQWMTRRSGPLMEFLKNFDAVLTQPGASNLEIPFGEGEIHDALLVHGNHLEEDDFEALRHAKNACVVHCPGSFAYFGHERFPFAELRKLGIPVALGTDSLASNSELDYLSEIRLFLKRYPDLSLAELLPLLTTNAAQAIGLKNTGRIEVGCRADFAGFALISGTTPLAVLQDAKRAGFVMVGGTKAL